MMKRLGSSLLGISFQDLKTVQYLELNAHLALEIFLIYMCFLCYLYLSRAAILPSNKNHFFITLATSSSESICSFIGALFFPSTDFVQQETFKGYLLFFTTSHSLFSKNRLHYFTTLLATVGFVGAVVVNLSLFVFYSFLYFKASIPSVKPKDAEASFPLVVLFYCCSFVSLALSLALNMEYITISFQFFLLFALFVLSLRHGCVSPATTWNVAGTSCGIFSLACTVASREFGKKPVVEAVFVNVKYFLDGAHFLYGITFFCLAKGAVVGYRWKKSRQEREEAKRKAVRKQVQIGSCHVILFSLGLMFQVCIN